MPDWLIVVLCWVIAAPAWMFTGWNLARASEHRRRRDMWHQIVADIDAQKAPTSQTDYAAFLLLDHPVGKRRQA